MTQVITNSFQEETNKTSRWKVRIHEDEKPHKSGNDKNIFLSTKENTNMRKLMVMVGKI